MINKYLENLYRQYISARGIKDKKIDLENIDFKGWLQELRGHTKKYKKYIETTNNIVVNSENVIELNKGFYDSISGVKTKIVSPYASTLDRENSIVDFNNLGEVDMVVTQNPFQLCNLDVLKNLSIKDIDFIIGLYGSTDDRDISLKYLYIKHYLEQVLSFDIKTEYVKDDGTYYNVFKLKK